MRRALVVLVAACGSAKAPLPGHAIPSDAPPGTRWVTPVLPWHPSDGVGGLVVAGPVALVGGYSRGEIEEIDLATGVRGRVHSLGKPLSVQSMERMSDGRYLIAGTLDDKVQAAIVDPVTFAPTWFTLDRVAHEADAYAVATARELPDHTVAITGLDLPLAIYDPKTLARVRVLDATPTWTELAVGTDAIYAGRSTATSTRFDLATGAATTSKGTVVAAAGGLVVERAYEKSAMVFRAQRGSEVRELPRTLGYAVALDETGARLASLRNGVVSVYSMRDNSVLATFDLAPQNMFSAKLVFAGERLLVAYANTLRVADLATRTLTSLPVPYGPYMQLGVDNGGTVTAIATEVWRFTDGALASTASLGRKTVVVTGTPLQRFATRTARSILTGPDGGKFPSVITVKTLEGRPIRDITLPRETDGGWLGESGDLVVAYKWDVEHSPTIARIHGGKISDIVSHHMDASVDDVDVDGGVAAVGLGGTITLLDLATGEKTRTVFNPRCAEYSVAQLERGGPRVITVDDKDAIVYDRTTGKVLGSATFPTAISDQTFFPGEPDILINTEDRLVLWNPTTNVAKQLVYKDAFGVQLSPDRRLAVVSLRDGRLALVDVAAFRAAMTPGPALPVATVPSACSTRDPLDLRDPDSMQDPDVHDDSWDVEEDEGGDGEDTGD